MGVRFNRIINCVICGSCESTYKTPHPICYKCWDEYFNNEKINFHIHIYEIKRKYEININANTGKEAKQKALKLL